MKFKEFIKLEENGDPSPEKLKLQLEMYLEKIANGIDVEVTKHFVERIFDRRISPKEIVETFSKFIEKYSSKLANNKKKKVGGVIQDIMKELNMPLEYDNNGTPSPKDDKLSLLTVMKKEGFVSNDENDKIFKVK